MQVTKTESIETQGPSKPDDSVRAAFGWPVFSVSNRFPATLRWAPGQEIDSASRLRLTVAIDSRQPTMHVTARLPEGEVVGRVELRYPFPHQPFDFPLSAEHSRGAVRSGLILEMEESDSVLWFFGVEPAAATASPCLLAEPLGPLGAGDKLAAFRRWLSSPASLQNYGWRLGCVLDGLHDLQDSAWRTHLTYYFDRDHRLIYEDPKSRPMIDDPCGIEDTLPHVHVARAMPDHPCVKRCIDYWLGSRNEAGNVGGDFVSAEGSYTVAYPMASMGIQYRREELVDAAIDQLCIRRDRLCVGPDFWLRYDALGRRTYRNWARGCAWYLLGLARTLIVLQGHDHKALGALREEFKRAADQLLVHQLPSGLWATFIDQGDSPIDTSGSAGMAAAIALGTKHGLLPGTYRSAAERAFESLVGHLSSDGVMLHAAQDNRGGEALQRSDYRVIHAAGAGLFAQLLAALDSPAM